MPLFNGKDLTGWHNVNCAPGTFYVKDGMIITTGVPTGYLRIGQAVRELHPRIRLVPRIRPRRERSATPACSSGAIRFPPSAPATRAASRCRCSSTWKVKDTVHQPGRSLQHLGGQVQARSAASQGLGTLLAERESLQGRI